MHAKLDSNQATRTQLLICGNSGIEEAISQLQDVGNSIGQIYIKRTLKRHTNYVQYVGLIQILVLTNQIQKERDTWGKFEHGLGSR